MLSMNFHQKGNKYMLGVYHMKPHYTKDVKKQYPQQSKLRLNQSCKHYFVTYRQQHQRTFFFLHDKMTNHDKGSYIKIAV